MFQRVNVDVSLRDVLDDACAPPFPFPLGTRRVDVELAVSRSRSRSGSPNVCLAVALWRFHDIPHRRR